MIQKPFLEALPKVYGSEEAMEHLAEPYGSWFAYWGFYFRRQHGERTRVLGWQDLDLEVAKREPSLTHILKHTLSTACG